MRRFWFTLDEIVRIPIETLLLAFLAKPGIQVRGIWVHLGVVIIAMGMLFLQAEVAAMSAESMMWSRSRIYPWALACATNWLKNF